MMTDTNDSRTTIPIDTLNSTATASALSTGRLIDVESVEAATTTRSGKTAIANQKPQRLSMKRPAPARMEAIERTLKTHRSALAPNVKTNRYKPATI